MPLCSSVSRLWHFSCSNSFRNGKFIPVQYLLVGGALCVFYTLLVSLSEHIGFSWAYTVLSVATILLISMCFYNIIKTKKGTALLTLMLTGLYLLLFTILQLQDYALLMGSIGLFVVITVIMYISRNVEWYGSRDK